MKNLYKSVLMPILLVFALTSKAQVPVLNSYPSANAVIFLDFDGQTVDNTSWNYAGPIVCNPSNLDNVKITSVFNRVAEDYRPFNINVTTDSTRFFAASPFTRMRIIITTSWEWYGAAGGVSMVGSFTWGDDTPGFVFSGQLGYNVKYISEAVSHEAGHTLGLYHQANWDANCVKISDYHYGVGTGEISWAPIMGVGYYKNLTLWNNGATPTACAAYQSDLSVITGSNGFSFRPDDYASNFTDAANITFTNNQFNVSGVITQSTDQDMVKFTLPGSGHFVLNAIPYNVGTGNEGSDLDLQVTLYNSSHAMLNVYNPGTLLNSVIDTVLNSGTYFLKVEGKGNIYAPNYASLGSYSLQGIFGSGTLPLRRLELRGSQVNDNHRLTWLIDADEQVVEQVLESSTSGRNFAALTQPGITDRSYNYNPGINNAVQYRLKVTFDNGRINYSNIVTLKSTNNDTRPKILSNLVNNSITVTSPGKYSYEVYDMNGKLAAKGQLVNGMNTIPAAALNGGMYMIRFNDDSNQWTDKFIRQ